MSGYRPEYMRAYREAHREKIRAQAREWYWRNREEVLAAQKVRRDPAQERERMLTYKFGLTMEAFAALLESQGRACAICETELSVTHKMHVDHDHACCPGAKTCGRCVRGILCARCNTRLPMVEDPELLKKASVYLERVR